MNDKSWLELLDIYTEMAEKQDDIIRRMGKIIARQARALQLIENDREFSDPALDREIAAMEEAKRDYDGCFKA